MGLGQSGSDSRCLSGVLDTLVDRIMTPAGVVHLQSAGTLSHSGTKLQLFNFIFD